MTVDTITYGQRPTTSRNWLIPVRTIHWQLAIFRTRGTQSAIVPDGQVGRGGAVERSIELERLVADWFEHASRGDSSIVETRVSASTAVYLIGSDPAEMYRGGAAVVAFLKGEVDSAGGRVTFTPESIEAFSEGTVGWASTNLTITLPDGARVSPRWTSVFHREDGIWKFVQTHASIGVPNNEVGWLYPG
jgi:hypothetical protein